APPRHPHGYPGTRDSAPAAVTAATAPHAPAQSVQDGTYGQLRNTTPQNYNTGSGPFSRVSLRPLKWRCTMSEARLDYYAHNKDAILHLAGTRRHLKQLSPALSSLVELRVSQINGCAYCLS